MSLTTMVLRTPKRFNSSLQSSSVLTSTPVNNTRPNKDDEPAQSPIERSQSIVSPGQLNNTSVRSNKGTGKHLTETPILRYNMRSRDRSDISKDNSPASKSIDNKKAHAPLIYLNTRNSVVNKTYNDVRVEVFRTPETRSHSGSLKVLNERRRSRTVDGSETDLKKRTSNLCNGKKENIENKNDKGTCDISNKKIGCRRISTSFQELVNIGNPQNFEGTMDNFIGVLNGNVAKIKSVSSPKKQSKLPHKLFDKNVLKDLSLLNSQHTKMASSEVNKNSVLNKETVIAVNQQSIPNRGNKNVAPSKSKSLPNKKSNISGNSLILKAIKNLSSQRSKITNKNDENIVTQKVGEADLNGASSTDIHQNTSGGDSSDSGSCRNSDNFCSTSSLKPSFIRRKLYSRSSDFTGEENKQANNSFLEKKDVKCVYSLNKKELSTSKNISTDNQEIKCKNDLPNDSTKSADTSKKYHLRTARTSYRHFFGEKVESIDGKAGNAKENTCKLVNNFLKDINNKSNPPVPNANQSQDLPKAIDQPGDVSKKRVENAKKNTKKKKVADLEVSAIDLFSSNESSETSYKENTKVSKKVSKTKQPSKIVKKQITDSNTNRSSKVLDLPKKKSKVSPKTKSVKTFYNYDISESKALDLPKKSSKVSTKTKSVNNFNKNDISECNITLYRSQLVENKLKHIRSTIVQKKISKVVSVPKDISGHVAADPTLKSMLSELSGADFLQNDSLSKKPKNKSLEISYTKKILRHRKSKDPEIKENRSKGRDGTMLMPHQNFSNDTILFKNGKLVSGNFGVNSTVNLSSSRDFYNPLMNTGSSRMPNIKINYKTKLNDYYRGMNNFETFEDSYNQNRFSNYLSRGVNESSSSVRRMAMNVVNESKYVFKKPESVLWNPKPSIEYGVCAMKKQDRFSNSTLSLNKTSLVDQLGLSRNRVYYSEEGSRKGYDNKLCADPHRESVFEFGKSRNEYLNNPMQKFPSDIRNTRYPEIHNDITNNFQFDEDRYHIQRERSRNGYGAPSTRKPCNPAFGEGISDFKNYGSSYQVSDGRSRNTITGSSMSKPYSAFNENISDFRLNKVSRNTTGPMVRKPCYPEFEDISDYRNDREPYIMPNERNINNTGTSFPTRRPCYPEYDENLSEYGNNIDPYQLSNERPRNAIIPTSRKTSYYPDFEEDISKLRKNTESYQAQNKRPQNTIVPSSLRKPHLPNFQEDSYIRNSEDPYQLCNERPRITLSNPLRKCTSNYRFGESYLDDQDCDENPFQDTRDRFRNTLSNPSRNPGPSTYSESVSAFKRQRDEPFKSSKECLRKGNPCKVGYPYSERDRDFDLNSMDIDVNTFSIPMECESVLPHSVQSRRRTRAIGTSSDNFKQEISRVMQEPNFLDYSEVDTFRMPIEPRANKRKVIQREEFSECKKSRFEDSRFSAISNIQSSSTKGDIIRRPDNKSVCTFILKSSTLISQHSSPEVVTGGNKNLLVNGKHQALPMDYNMDDNLSECQSNYFSDNEHEDTVVRLPDNVPEKQAQIFKKTEKDKPATEVVEQTKPKFIICEEETVGVKKNNKRDGDDDTFFFKGSYTTPASAEITNKVPDTSDVLTLQSVHGKPSFISGFNATKMEINSSAIVNKFKNFHNSIQSKAGNVAESQTLRLQDKFPLKRDRGFSVPVTEKVDDNFKKPDVKKTYLFGKPSTSRDDQKEIPVNRASNCSPWRFSKW